MATPQLGNSLLKPESGWTRKHCSLANVGPGNFLRYATIRKSCCTNWKMGCSGR